MKEQFSDGEITFQILFKSCKLPKTQIFSSHEKKQELRRQSLCNFLQLLVQIPEIPSECLSFLEIFKDRVQNLPFHNQNEKTVGTSNATNRLIRDFFDKIVAVSLRSKQQKLTCHQLQHNLQIISEDELNFRTVQLQSLLDKSAQKCDISSLLDFCDFSVKSAAVLYKDLLSAGQLKIAEIPDNFSMVHGADQGGNTCYIDSLLFAMFATNTAHDWMITKSLDDGEESEKLEVLQVHLCFYVNQLRKGRLLSGCHTHVLRECLMECGWLNSGSAEMRKRMIYSQQDASELYLFLLSKFGSSTLRTTEKLFHGGIFSSNDVKNVDERVLNLSLPNIVDPNASITLEEVLRSNFFDSKIGSLKRLIEKSGEDHLIAWKQTLLRCETKGIERATGQSNRMIIPMVLNRFKQLKNGLAVKNDIRVKIPLKMDFTNYMDQRHSSAGDYLLVLRSVVCHLGSSNIQSGHYYTFSSMTASKDDQNKVTDVGEKGWLYFNDMYVGPKMHDRSRVTVIQEQKELLKLFEDELPVCSYILFYELNDSKGLNNYVLKLLSETEDLHLARKIQFENVDGESDSNSAASDICSIA